MTRLYQAILCHRIMSDKKESSFIVAKDTVAAVNTIQSRNLYDLNAYELVELRLIGDEGANLVFEATQ